jgi:general secretion pathway protein B
MSYILDALRRAEADREREKSAVPGLHSQPRPATPADALRAPAPLALRAGGAALVVVVLGGAAWWALRGTGAGAPAAPPVPVAQAPAPPVPVAQAPAPRVVAAPPEVVRLPEPAPALTAAPVAASVVAPAASRAPAPAAMLPPVPADLRLVAGGSIWSDTPSSRMLILNGQVFHEGEHPAPDVTLEKIGPKSAVLVVRGARYLLTY